MECIPEQLLTRAGSWPVILAQTSRMAALEPMRTDENRFVVVGICISLQAKACYPVDWQMTRNPVNTSRTAWDKL